MRNIESAKLMGDRLSGWRRLGVMSLFLLLGGLLRAQNQTISPPREWATSLGGVNVDFISDAVSDGQGGIYVTGYTNSPNFPTTLAGSPGAGYDVFVARFDSLGSVLWSTRYGGSGGDFGNAIARDGTGNLLIAGKLGGQGTFVTDSTYKGTGDDMLVLKLSASGSFISAMRYGGSAADEAMGISTGTNDHIVVVGNSSSTNIPTTSALYNGTSGDAFALRLRSDLTRHWAFRYGGNSFDKANDIAINPATGDVYVAGETGSSDFQQTINTYQGSGGAKAFVMRFDSVGTRTWSQRYGGSGVERAYALDLPANGGLLVVGYTTSTNFPQSITGLGGAGLDAFLIHLNLDGTRDYARRLGGSLDDLAIDLSTDASGNIFMAGETQSVNFPSSNDAYKGAGRDQFVAKFGPMGDYVWSFPYGGLLNDFSGGAVTSNAASVYLAGHTQSINYPQTLTGTGGNTARGTVLRLRDCLGQDADFSFQHVCEFDTVHFQNLSVRGTSDTIAHRWWFGDGDSSDVVNPSHYYSSPGSYEVMLRVTSTCGLDSFMTKWVNVYPAPRMNWGHSNACATRYTEFMDSTVLDTVVGSVEAAWAWDFGNGDNSTLQNPTYIYSTAGNYGVHFTVWTNHGCRDSLVDTVRVHHRPFADFAVADVCLRDTAHFNDNTTIGGDALATWAWDFGINGDTSILQNPNYLYTLPDTFAVELIVTSDQGCSDTILKPIRVLPLPTVDFGMTAVCWPDTVTYTDSSSIAGDMIAGYEWHFGDNLTDTLQNTWHSYAASGDYDVVLWVFTASGCSDSLLTTLKVNDKPTAHFGFQNVCWPETTMFSDSSAVLADSLVTWNWTFGDGGMESIPSPSHQFAVADTYAVSLEVISAFGCSDTAWENVIVYPKPTAYFQATDVCYPIHASFQDGSSVTGDVLSGFNWAFGDGNTGTGMQTTHVYGQAGEYEVTLVVETASGCRDTVLDSLEIYPQPGADFGIENVCDGDTVFLTDSSTVVSGTINAYWYAFGDGNGANTANAAWVYPSDGIFFVTHIVESDHACLDTIVKQLEIFPLPHPHPALVGYTDICIGDTVVLQESQAFPHYEWETGDTTSWITIHDRSDWVVLTVTDGNGCENSDSVEVRFHAVPRPNAVVTPGPNILTCANDSLMVTAGGSYAFYQWSDGPTTGIRYVGQAGPLAVLVMNGFGCADTSDTALVTILPAPAAPVITQNGSLLSVPAAAAYQWYLNGLAIPNATAQQYNAIATGNYSVMVTGANGCSSWSSTLSMVVGTTPVFFADFSISPNPFTTETHLAGTLKKGGLLQIRLINTTGQVVLEKAMTVSAGGFEQVLETADLPAGYYVCQMTLGKEVLHRALVKQ